MLMNVMQCKLSMRIPLLIGIKFDFMVTDVGNMFGSHRSICSSRCFAKVCRGLNSVLNIFNQRHRILYKQVQEMQWIIYRITYVEIATINTFRYFKAICNHICIKIILKAALAGSEEMLLQDVFFRESKGAMLHFYVIEHITMEKCQTYTVSNYECTHGYALYM